ncbi:hypothetical protein ACKWTF_015231 [Chironomus riparius]
MEVHCTFDSTKDYICTVTNCQISNGVQLKFSGDHKDPKTDDDVVGIKFVDCYITKVPQGLTKRFPNLNSLTINNTNLKSLTKFDLAEYKNFKEFDFSNNQIEFLPGDLFEDFKNCEKISFNGNKLTLVEPNILDGLTNLKVVNLIGETAYGSLNLPAAASNWDPNLKGIKLAILNNLMENDDQIIKDYIINLQLKIQTIKQIDRHEIDELTEKTQSLEQANNILVCGNRLLSESKENLLKEVEQLKANVEQLTVTEEILRQKIKDLKQELVESNECSETVKKLCEVVEQEFEDYKKNIHNKSDTDDYFSTSIKSFIQKDEIFKDFRVQISEQEFAVHKILLAARSPTLAEVLRKNSDVQNLNLVDISVEIFEKILKFLYNDELPGADWTDFLGLFSAAGRLQIQELKDYAAQKVIKIVGSENALEVLNLSNKYEHDGLMQKAFQEIKKKYPESKFKDELISSREKVEKFIEFLKKIEEAEKGIESFA